MINKVVINHFKKFAQQEFDIPRHLVVVGPNNSGKTTLLQAIGAWAEIAYQWREKHPNLARENDNNYPYTELNSERFYSVPLTDFEHLWKDKNVHVQEPLTIWLHTDQWQIGFEIFYKAKEFAIARPAKNVKENDLEQYIKDPLIPIYVPPLSGVDIEERPFQPVVIPGLLARAQAGSVLRNMLLDVSQDGQKWRKLQEVVGSFFGYELEKPSPSTKILARYRHSARDPWYDLSSAASGFLQILLVYASLLHREASVWLIDEPDAHLHLLLQDKMYRDLYHFSQKTGAQLIIATHSERLINAVADADIENLRLLADNLKKVPNKSKVADTLQLENVEIVLAQTSPRMLYIEDFSDVNILREWARVLGHPSLPFLEKPIWKKTSQNRRNRPAVRHFSTMRLLVSDFRGVELRDGDNKKHRNLADPPEGMKRLFWDRYEIESYLLHPMSISRYVESKTSQVFAEKAEAYMKQQLPPAWYKNPFKSSDFLLGTKAKNVLSNIFQEAGLNVNESDFYQIAAQMTKEEIHPEVVKKLDAISAHFNLAEDKNKAEDSRK